MQLFLVFSKEKAKWLVSKLTLSGTLHDYKLLSQIQNSAFLFSIKSYLRRCCQVTHFYWTIAGNIKNLVDEEKYWGML